jgi:hypothetical protein
MYSGVARALEPLEEKILAKGLLVYRRMVFCIPSPVHDWIGFNRVTYN